MPLPKLIFISVLPLLPLAAAAQEPADPKVPEAMAEQYAQLLNDARNHQVIMKRLEEIESRIADAELSLTALNVHRDELLEQQASLANSDEELADLRAEIQAEMARLRDADEE